MFLPILQNPPFCSFDPSFFHMSKPRSILLWLPGIGAGGVIPVFPEGPLFPDHDCVRVAGKPRLEVSDVRVLREEEMLGNNVRMYIYNYIYI